MAWARKMPALTRPKTAATESIIANVPLCPLGERLLSRQEWSTLGHGPIALVGRGPRRWYDWRQPKCRDHGGPCICARRSRTCANEGGTGRQPKGRQYAWGQRSCGRCRCREPATTADGSADLRQRQGRHALDAGGTGDRHRSAAEGAGLAGCISHDVGEDRGACHDNDDQALAEQDDGGLDVRRDFHVDQSRSQESEQLDESHKALDRRKGRLSSLLRSSSRLKTALLISKRG